MPMKTGKAALKKVATPAKKAPAKQPVATKGAAKQPVATKTPAKKKATAAVPKKVSPATARVRSEAAPRATAVARPAFNEYAVWSPNNQSRAGTKVDLWLIHTQEGDGNADSLAHYLQGNVGVSYHYTISEDYNDRGVTVCDVVDTDLASWSVLSANNRSINLCFAGSRTSWTRAQWLQQSRAINVAAYLCVKDCVKYGIPTKVMPWGKYGAPGGITDHHYVTQYLGVGTHTDCGPNFPWDYFSQRIQYYADALTQPPPPPPDPGPVGPADDQLTLRWNMLGGQTLVEAVAEIRDKVLGTNDRPKPGSV
jgi:hypothetical protein